MVHFEQFLYVDKIIIGLKFHFPFQNKVVIRDGVLHLQARMSSSNVDCLFSIMLPTDGTPKAFRAAGHVEGSPYIISESLNRAFPLDELAKVRIVENANARRMNEEVIRDRDQLA